MDKKKRHISASRSKSKKSKPNDFSVDLKPAKQIHPQQSHEQSKIKTDNSLNKSKGSRKQSKQSKKSKLLKGSKDVSRSLSAQRKYSLTKMNKTEANFEQEDIEKRIYSLKKSLNKIHKPQSLNTRQILNFYREIQESIQVISQPLYSFLSYLHELYLQPIGEILDMISPYESLLRKKEELSRSVEEQMKQNQQIYKRMNEEDLMIIRLKEKIEEQRQQIEEKQRLHAEEIRRQKEITEKQQKTHEKTGIFSNEGVAKKMNKDRERMLTIQNDSVDFYEASNEKHDKVHPHEQQELMFKKNAIQPGGKGLKLDFGAIGKGETVGFHDEFYAQIDQFSESWREQALRQKRF